MLLVQYVNAKASRIWISKLGAALYHMEQARPKSWFQKIRAAIELQRFVVFKSRIKWGKLRRLCPRNLFDSEKCILYCTVLHMYVTEPHRRFGFSTFPRLVGVGLRVRVLFRLWVRHGITIGLGLIVLVSLRVRFRHWVGVWLWLWLWL